MLMALFINKITIKAKQKLKRFQFLFQVCFLSTVLSLTFLLFSKDENIKSLEHFFITFISQV